MVGHGIAVTYNLSSSSKMTMSDKTGARLGAITFQVGPTNASVAPLLELTLIILSVPQSYYKLQI